MGNICELYAFSNPIFGERFKVWRLYISSKYKVVYKLPLEPDFLKYSMRTKQDPWDGNSSKWSLHFHIPFFFNCKVFGFEGNLWSNWFQFLNDIFSIVVCLSSTAFIQKLFFMATQFLTNGFSTFLGIFIPLDLELRI